MYAIIQIGSSQFKVKEGDVIDADLLHEEEGKEIVLDKVLMVEKDADVQIGQPYLKNVKITAKVLAEEANGAKTVAMKFRKRKNSKSLVGHRQKYTTLAIEKIQL